MLGLHSERTKLRVCVNRCLSKLHSSLNSNKAYKKILTEDGAYTAARMEVRCGVALRAVREVREERTLPSERRSFVRRALQSDVLLCACESTEELSFARSSCLSLVAIERLLHSTLDNYGCRSARPDSATGINVSRQVRISSIDAGAAAVFESLSLSVPFTDH